MNNILNKIKNKLNEYDEEIANAVSNDSDKMVRSEIKMLLPGETIDYLFDLTSYGSDSKSISIFKLSTDKISDKEVQDIIQYKEDKKVLHRLLNVEPVDCGIKVSYIKDKDSLVMSLDDSVFT